jgi:hypothetical protein
MLLDYFPMVAMGLSMSLGTSRNDTAGVEVLMIPSRYGFHLGTVALIRPGHPAAACGLAQFDPVGRSITASVEPLSINPRPGL